MSREEREKALRELLGDELAEQVFDKAMDKAVEMAKEKSSDGLSDGLFDELGVSVMKAEFIASPFGVKFVCGSNAGVVKDWDLGNWLTRFADEIKPIAQKYGKELSEKKEKYFRNEFEKEFHTEASTFSSLAKFLFGGGIEDPESLK